MLRRETKINALSFIDSFFISVAPFFLSGQNRLGTLSDIANGSTRQNGMKVVC